MFRNKDVACLVAGIKFICFILFPETFVGSQLLPTVLDLVQEGQSDQPFFPQMIPQTWCDRSTFEFYWTPKTKAVWLEVKIDHNNRPEGPKSTEKGTLPRRRQQGFIHSTYFDSTPSQTIKSTHLIPGSTQSSSHGFHPGRSWLLMSLAPLIGSAAQDGESRRPDPAGR